jgi:hypothetical protein
MAERGKAEESQRTEAPDPVSRAELRGVLEHVRTIFGDSGAHVEFRYKVPAADPSSIDEVPSNVDIDPSSVDVVVEAKTEYNPRVAAALAWLRATADVLSDLEPDESVERDDAYYTEVRQAVGRGAPTVLLGTSNKALEASLREIKAAHKTRSEADHPARMPLDLTRRVRPGRVQRAALLVLVSLLGLFTVIVILNWDHQSSLANAILTSMIVVSGALLVAPKIWQHHKSEKDQTAASGSGRVEASRRAGEKEQLKFPSKEKKG